jgi:hypothetical protein
MSTLSPLSFERRSDRWTSDDGAEQYVRQLLVESRRAFENHWLDADTERGEFLPLMRETIPGQYGSNHGIDIFARDDLGHLWVIEVSRGTPRGAARFKGGGKPVKYAGLRLQMSEEWRRAAAEKFLAEQPDAIAMLRDLLHEDAAPDAAVRERFRMLMLAHRKAIIIPLGAHFDAIGTDLDFTREVYTCRFPSRLLHP